MPCYSCGREVEGTNRICVECANTEIAKKRRKENGGWLSSTKTLIALIVITVLTIGAGIFILAMEPEQINLVFKYFKTDSYNNETSTFRNRSDCGDDCPYASCGNGIVEPEHEETCEPTLIHGCRAVDCGSCGDQIVQSNFEDCDDGNLDNTDECTNYCRTPGCGDEIIQVDEECDHGESNGDSTVMFIVDRVRYFCTDDCLQQEVQCEVTIELEDEIVLLDEDTCPNCEQQDESPNEITEKVVKQIAEQAAKNKVHEKTVELVEEQITDVSKVCIQKTINQCRVNPDCLGLN